MEPTQQPPGPRSRAWAIFWLAVLLVVSAVVAGFVNLIVGLEECGMFGPPPAPASPQGGVCGNNESAWRVVPVASWVFGALTPPLAAALVYRREGGPAAMGIGIGALLAVPLLVGLANSAPSDECSAEQRRELPRWACNNVDRHPPEGRP